MTLRSKILLLLATVSLVPLILLSGLGIYFVNLTQRYSISQLETQLIRQKEKEIEKFFNDTRTLFHLQVAYPVSALSGIPNEQLESILRLMTQANKDITEISFLEYDQSYPDKPEIGMELIKLAGGEKTADPQSQKNSPKFIKTVSGSDYFGPVYKIGDEYFITVSSPVKNNDGIIIGVLSGEISLQPVIRLVNEGTLGSAGYLILSDDKGEIWSKPQRLSQRHFGSNVYILSVLGGWIGTGLGDKDRYVSSFGEPVISSGIKIRDLNWALIAEWPASDAYAVVYSMIRQAALFFFIILGAVAAAAILFSLRIIRPIGVLGKGAKIIGQGDFSHRIDIDTGDELEELASYFNEMARNLKEVEELREAKARMEGLAKSLEKEKELSQIKDHFISTASHQLRTPISVIRWTAEILKSAGLSDPDKEAIKSQMEIIHKNAASLALVMGDILTVAELGIGYKLETMAELSLKNTTEEIINEFQKEIKAKNIAVNLKISDEECRVKASGVNIKRALINLVDNAITYTKPGGKIDIELERHGNEVLFSIKDTGIGIPAEDHGFIFNEFFRARNAVEMKNVGTGLGLFIVKTVIDGHGGKMGFESSETGSRFWFSLPEMRLSQGNDNVRVEGNRNVRV